jgi:hypothetical protein
MSQATLTGQLTVLTAFTRDIQRQTDSYQALQ